MTVLTLLEYSDSGSDHDGRSRFRREEGISQSDQTSLLAKQLSLFYRRHHPGREKQLGIEIGQTRGQKRRPADIEDRLDGTFVQGIDSKVARRVINKEFYLIFFPSSLRGEGFRVFIGSNFTRPRKDVGAISFS